MTSKDEEFTGEEPEVTEHQIVFPKLTHVWRSKGNSVYCLTCPNPHGFDLPPGFHLTGIEIDGTPRIENVFKKPPQDEGLEAVV